MRIGTNILGCAAGLLRKAAVAVRCGDGRGVLNRRNEVQNTNRATVCPKGAGLNFIPAIWTLVEEARREIDVAWRLAGRVLVGSGHTRPSRW
jgi:hypothetical protein